MNDDDERNEIEKLLDLNVNINFDSIDGVVCRGLRCGSSAVVFPSSVLTMTTTTMTTGTVF